MRAPSPRVSRLGLLTPAVLLAFAPAAIAQGKKSSDKTKASAVRGYKRATIQGFTLMINEEVYKHNDDEEWKRKPREGLELEWTTIARKLPDRSVKALRGLVVWVEWEDKSDPDFGKAVAKYYGVNGANGGVWMLGKNKHPLKANNIEIISMRSLTREHQPGVKLERCVLLHEMAHGVHHQLFGWGNPHVKAAYKQATDRHLYDEATDVYGRTLKPPYASKSSAEYFAELSCAYLDKLHYFPFTASDLQKHDAVGYRMMEQTWGTRKKIDAAVKVKTEAEAGRQLDSAKSLYLKNRKPEAIEKADQIVTRFPTTKAAASARKLLEKWKE